MAKKKKPATLDTKPEPVADEGWWIALDTYKAMRRERDELAAKLPAGLAALDAPVDVGYQWTDAELAAYDPLEPIPPARPGQLSGADDTIASYEYEVVALQQQVATLTSALERIGQYATDYLPGRDYVQNIKAMIDEGLNRPPAQRTGGGR